MADVIVYAGSLVNRALLRRARPGCRLVDSASLALPEILKVMITAARAGRRVLRLHTGDPALYGAIAEQMAGLREAGIPYDVIPGVTSALAAAAAVGAELTLPGVSQTVILTRRAGRTPVPLGQDLVGLAAHQATMALFLSVDEIADMVADLRAGGYPADTPAVAVYRASWPDQVIVRGTLSDLVRKVRAAGLKRQTIVLVGRALAGKGTASKLYDPGFAHGYRPAAPHTAEALPPQASEPLGFLGRVAVYALTEQGCRLAERLARRLGGQAFCSRKHAANATAAGFDPEELGRLVADQWRAFEGHVFIMSVGIVVRKIASLLRDKTTDPAVVVCDERGRHAVSLLGGHIGGANRLAVQVAALLGGTPVITTATDAQGLPAFDEIAARLGWHVQNPDAIKHVNSLLLSGRPIAVVWPEAILTRFYGNLRPALKLLAPGARLPAGAQGAVLLDSPVPRGLGRRPALRLARLPLVVGLGFNRGVSAERLESAIRETLRELAAPDSAVRAIATIDLKRGDPALTDLAARKGWSVTCHSAAALRQVRTPNPSAAVEKATGTPSVAEAAALLTSRGRLILPKRKLGDVTVAVAAAPAPQVRSVSNGKVWAVGIGPGADSDLTPRARAALAEAEVVVGYRPYCDSLGRLLEGKRVLASGMRQEVARCEEALREAAAGARVAVVSSGDAGIYGMAGLLLELAEARGMDDLAIEVVPGVTAAIAAAAVLGAPLANDFAVLSLSDCLTPRPDILRRLKAVAAADLVTVLYNPRSRSRHDLLDKALALFAQTGRPGRLAGVVWNATRPNQRVWIGPLRRLPVREVDMSTVVVIGNAHTRLVSGRLVTVRGYDLSVCTGLNGDRNTKA
jgi:cobalt-precorrin 5A hydrolase/precorrin-3B C17-methyltransferase